MNRAYLLTGGNLGNRLNNLIDACKLIEQYCGKIVQRSAIYKTAAWGFTDQPDFYNQALEIQTGLSPEQLIQELLTIEKQMGRKRDVKMGPRIIDIDILLFNNEIVHKPHLTIPHPRLHERRFALTPLAEIAPDIIHPVIHKTIQQLLMECTDTLNVHKIEENN
ncbi:MAG TPA: 2-amino-4-hydroxy-6-hydroxymethyldihydropteridine diphosphokinase [Chitinophagaceae bacterium]|jgi:2-amino-4-hydroxy-6-hydroxymethyldihydropteridine diphosphokinase